MFLPWETICCSKDFMSRRNYNERRLKFLQWMRDDLEARLAGINAAIQTVERQINEDDTSPSTTM
ncbi:hypothetical protein [Gloeocapsa sp. PCC 73106]|uniref:hypothetical protein n=1 Tax=Gloeocapsa sp. PCC 73106 TaxID=102232 RepID=UPI0002ABA6DD|nr:hypothetical protein [Gloeocapsa sp. PCC 73106]ELR99016.1 hypothetical protein GLO73106DRAFT_00028600 [Gloeocapsa sp. PCC 73106]